MQLSALGITPVSGDNPAGADARYDPEYVTLVAEIDKLGFSGKGEAISWPVVVTHASSILATKAKDIQAACYLAVALLERDGLPGLRDGLRILNDLLRTFWETAFPPLKRPRGRINALDWFRERVLVRLQGMENPDAVPAALHEELLTLLAALDDRIADVLPDAASLRELSAALSRFPVSAPEALPETSASPNSGAFATPEAPRSAASESDRPTAATATEGPPPAVANASSAHADSDAPPVTPDTSPAVGNDVVSPIQASHESSGAQAPARMPPAASESPAVENFFPATAESMPQTPVPAPAMPTSAASIVSAASPPAPITSAVPVPAAPAAPGQPVSPPTPPSEERLAARNELVAATRKYVFLAHKEDPADPTPWRFLRLALWGRVAALPPSERNQTHLPPPDSDRLEALNGLLRADKCLDAALRAEELFVDSLFCLDAQALTDAALSRLGPAFAPAAAAVREETARFVRRLPGLDQLSFSDGSPFASPAAQAWLRGLGHGAPGAGRPLSASAPKAEDSPAMGKARELASQNNLAEALDILDAALGNSGAANLRLRLAQLELVLQAGEALCAQSLAEHALHEVENANLEAWDPPFALEALLLVREATELFSETIHSERARALDKRIARLRPAAVLKR